MLNTCVDADRETISRKILYPIERSCKNGNMIVGLLNYQEVCEPNTIKEEVESIDDHKYMSYSIMDEEIAPPVLIMMNFAKEKPKRNTDKLDEVSSQFIDNASLMYSHVLFSAIRKLTFAHLGRKGSLAVASMRGLDRS